MESSRELAVPGERSPALRFASFGSLTVRQRKRWLELLLSFEMKNSYDVYDAATVLLDVVHFERGKG